MYYKNTVRWNHSILRLWSFVVSDNHKDTISHQEDLKFLNKRRISCMFYCKTSSPLRITWFHNYANFNYFMAVFLHIEKWLCKIQFLYTSEKDKQLKIKSQLQFQSECRIYVLQAVTKMFFFYEALYLGKLS
jgi:hypothetical protein